MSISRRGFVASSSGSLIGLSTPGWLHAIAHTRGSWLMSAAGGNRFMAFNNIRDAEDGESDEFTTISNIERLLRQHEVPHGTTVIGIGARSGTPDNPFGLPGEMGYRWTYGEDWNGVVTSPSDARPVPLGKDDPITVTQVGVLNEDTAHTLVLDGAEAAGRVLWTFYEDETTRPIVRVGFHNAFSDVDGGMMDAIYKISREVRRTGRINAQQRSRLQRFIPALRDERIWANFATSLGRPALESDWLSYIRQQGWQGAAVVLRGSFSNVAQFHLREWNQLSPSDPGVQIGRGTHLPPLNVRYGREVRPFIDNDDAEWTMVGFLWDRRSTRSSPSMTTWSKAIDLFGHDFHIHGFRDDGRHGGHTLFSLLGQGRLEVKLYPLQFREGETAHIFNNDLELLPETLSQTSDVLRVGVRNNGENYLRNVEARLEDDDDDDDNEVIKIAVLGPRETVWLDFRGRVGRTAGMERKLILDPEKRYLEGGQARRNNEIRIKRDLTWRWR